MQRGGAKGATALGIEQGASIFVKMTKERLSDFFATAYRFFLKNVCVNGNFGVNA